MGLIGWRLLTQIVNEAATIGDAFGEWEGGDAPLDEDARKW